MAYLYITITYVNMLILCHVGLVEIFRMIGHSLLSKMLRLLKLGLSDYAEKTRFGVF